MGEKILGLRALGYTYDKIVEELGCSKSLVCYHCGPNQKTKSKNRADKKLWKSMLSKKIFSFKARYKEPLYRKFTRTDIEIMKLKIQTFNKRGSAMNDLTSSEFLEKYEGKEVKCYITGELIDVTKPRTYHFDHIKPKSKGGDNSINNLGICTKQANLAKSDLNYEEFVELCKKVVKHHEENN